MNISEQSDLIKSFYNYITVDFFKNYKIIKNEISGDINFDFIVCNEKGDKFNYIFFLEQQNKALKVTLSILCDDKDLLKKEYLKYFDIEKVQTVLNEIKKQGLKYSCIEEFDFDISKFNKIRKNSFMGCEGFRYIYALNLFRKFTKINYQKHIQKNRSNYKVNFGCLSIEFYFYYSKGIFQSNIDIKIPINFENYYDINIQQNIEGLENIENKYKNEIKRAISKEFNLTEIEDSEIDNYINLLSMKFY